jgi:hypothetical protein
MQVCNLPASFFALAQQPFGVFVQYGLLTRQKRVV